MSVRLSPNIPTNVVEIGQEITQGVVDALNNASAPSATNPYLTLTAGGAYYLEKAGGGTVVGSIVVDTDGTVGGDVTTINGTSVEVNNFGVGLIKIDPVLGVTFPDATSQGTAGAVPGASNTFTASQVISVTDNSAPALRITQLGTGEAFRVEDSANPDSTPFVIDASGRVGIGFATPGVQLDVSGRASFATTAVSTGTAFNFSVGQNTYSGAGILLNYAGTTNAFLITNTGAGTSFRVNDEASDTTPFIVDAGGNVGVKTASPSTDFEVNGNAKFTTGELTTAPAAGDSSAKIPTTAWVQAEVPAASTTVAGKVELATDAETMAGFSNSTVPTPWAIREAANILFYSSSGTGTAVVNGGQSVASTYDAFTIFTSSTLANSTATRYSTTFANSVHPKPIPGHRSYALNFAKPVAIHWAIQPSYGNYTQFSHLNFFVGQEHNNFLAAANQEVPKIGFGFSILPGGSMKISARNASGVTSTTVANAWVSSRNVDTLPIEVYQYSDGNGNLYTYVDGVLIDTNTAAPTTHTDASISFFTMWACGISNGATTPTAPAIWSVNFPKMYLAP